MYLYSYFKNVCRIVDSRLLLKPNGTQWISSSTNILLLF